MQLKRHVLEQWADKPFFDETVAGCVVRIAVGTYDDPNTGQQLPNYIMARVEGVREKQSYRCVCFVCCVGRAVCQRVCWNCVGGARPSRVRKAVVQVRRGGKGAAAASRY